MADLIKGNFKPQNPIEEGKVNEEDELEERFEKEVLKHLGGSVAFVAKKRVNWESKDES